MIIYYGVFLLSFKYGKKKKVLSRLQYWCLLFQIIEVHLGQAQWYLMIVISMSLYV